MLTADHDPAGTLPPDARLEVLARLQHVTRADLVITYRLVRARDTGRVHLARPLALGPAALVAQIAEMDGMLFDCMGVDVDHQSSFDRFTPHRIDEIPDAIRASWDAMGIVDGLGLNVECKGGLAGSIYAYRLKGGAGMFEQRAERAANRISADVAEALCADAEARGMDGHPASSFVMGLDGRVVYRPQGVPEPRVTPQFRERVKAFLQDRGPEAFMAHGRMVNLTRLSGPAGKAALVTTQPTDLLTVQPIMRLTPLKRRIIGFAARGATVGEIADVMCRSPETIRTHLKRVYDQLGVSNRVELAELCRDLWS